MNPPLPTCQYWRILFIVLITTCVISCSDDDEMMKMEEELDLIDLEGNWTGNWYDNFGNTPGTLNGTEITVTISSSGLGRFQGPLYYSHNGPYEPCCMDVGNNGQFSFKVEDTPVVKGDTITDFVFNQKLTEYMGGCSGKFTGSGRVNLAGQIEIDFTGNDCRGEHVGTLTMHKE